MQHNDNLDRDGHEKLILEGEIELSSLGYGCRHSIEATDFGLLRIKMLMDADADDKRIETEVKHSDPVVQMYLFVGIQHAAHEVFYGLKEMWRKYRTSVRSFSLVGGKLPAELDDDDWAYNVYKPLAESFERVFVELLPRYLERMQNLHDEEHNLVPWAYAELDVPSKPEMVAPVVLSAEEQQRVANLLLNWEEDDDA